MIASPTRKLIITTSAVMTVAALVFAVTTWVRLRDSIASIEESHARLLTWERFLSLVKDAETGQRGFQISGDEAYLEPFYLAERLLPDFQSKLDAGDEQEMPAVKELAVQKLNDLRESITIRKREGREPAREFILTGKGKTIMDAIRTQVGMVTARLNERVSMRTAQMQSDLQWGYLSAGACGLVALGGAVVSLLLFRQLVSQLREQTRLAGEKERAEESDRQKSAFLATMSHEIRTPMNAILGFGELLEGEVGTAKQKQHVQAILAGGRSLLQLINDILDLSKIEAGMMAMNPGPVDVSELAAFVQQLFAEQAMSKGVELRVETAPDLPRSLLLDAVRLRQVLVNVAGNALKFTDRGHILLRLGGGQHEEHRSCWKLLIEIEDTGAGIAPERLDDIFKPFVQGGNRPAEQKGTGLGLAIVKRLVELMQGNISVTSSVGTGTTFRMEFPEVEVSARLPQTITGPETEVNFNDLQPSSLLVADDNETNRQLVQHLFEASHHRVRFVSNGREAVDAILADRPDVVLMDIRMPVMDGREALTALRAQAGLELLPVIAVTASSLSAEEAGLRRAFNGYVRKPFSRAELFRELSQFIPCCEKQPDPEAQALPLDDSGLDAWRFLLSILRDEEKNHWPAVEAGMVMSEICEFALRLSSAAAVAKCPPVAEYAARLQAEADAFSVSALEKSLTEFPSLVTAVENRLTS